MASEHVVGPAWQLVGLAANLPYPANCEVAFSCAHCGTPRAFHDSGVRVNGFLVCDEVCARDVLQAQARGEAPTFAPRYSLDALLDAALLKVESVSIRAWVVKQRDIWLRIVESAREQNPRLDPDRLAAYIVIVAIGL